MDKLLAGKNTVFSSTPELNASEIQVQARIVDELGGEVKPFVNATFEETKSAYKAEFDITADDVKGKYLRVIWKASKENNPIPLANYMVVYEFVKEDAVTVELVAPEYFTEFGLQSGVDSRLRAVLRRATPDNIRSILRASTGDLARAIKASLYPVEHVMEKKDLFNEGYTDTFWMVQPHHKPLIELKAYELWYSNQKIMTLDVNQHFVIDKDMNTIEFLPSSLRGIQFYQQFINAVTAVAGFTGAMHRLPGFFRITYTAGLDFFNLDETEQDSIRHAICRQAMLYHLGRLDPNVYGSSISKSVDGASKSVSYAGLPWLQQLSVTHEQWKSEKMRELGTNYEMVIS